MRNDASTHASSPRASRSSSSFFRSILRNVSAGASNLASTVRSAGSSVTSSISIAEEQHQREQVHWAGFDRIELGPGNTRRVLLLTYSNGFQVWDVEKVNHVFELASKRDGPVAFLRVQPQPSPDGGLKAARPLLLVITGDMANCIAPCGLANGYSGVVGNPPPSAMVNHFTPTVLKFYSLCSHAYVHELRFRTAIYTVRCSPRVVVVALVSQLYCIDAATLQHTFSVLMYPSPQAGEVGPCIGYGAVAVGPRWLAYAANQPVISNTGRVSPQHLTPSPGVSPSTSPANGSLVAHYAKESSKQIAAGIVSLGDTGYKTLSRYYSEFLPEGAGSPVLGSPIQKNCCNGHPHELEHAGTVIVRDFLTKAVVAHFRAHESPLSALCFDPTGTLLVTASIYGHNINVFRIMPTAYDATTSHVHLYKLARGMTKAVIQDVAFSEDSHWIVVGSSRGTVHLFAISPFGGPVGPYTHRTGHFAKVIGTSMSMQLLPWWSNVGPLKSCQQTTLPPPPTVNLPVISRIKNGNSGWRGAVSGAAAAASGRSYSTSGAVAVLFHDGGGGRGCNVDAEADDSLKEQLWVLTPSGDLIMHIIHLSVGTEGYSNGGVSPSSSKDMLDLRVVVEPLKKWGVCRRPNWIEREEKLISSNGAEVQANTPRTSSYSNGENMRWSFGNETFGSMPDEMHQSFLSHAEVHMCHCKAPLWAKSKVSFHVFTDGLSEKGKNGGEMEIEKILTRVMEVKKRDVVPICDRLEDFHFRKDTRHLPTNSMLNSSSLNLRLSKDDGVQHGFICTDDVGVAQIQQSSSGSSCGSEGSLYSLPVNGFYLSHQDSSPDRAMGFPDDQHPSMSILYQSQQNSDEAKLACAIMKPEKHAPPFACNLSQTQLDISKLGIPRLGEKPVVVLNPTGLEPERIMLHVNGSTEGAVLKTANGTDIPSSCEGHIDVSSNAAHSFIPSHGVLNSAAITTDNHWIACEDDDEAGLHAVEASGLDQDSGRSSRGLLNHLENFHMQDCDVMTEDNECADANSKCGDLREAEDGWEGAMFPFAEDC